MTDTRKCPPLGMGSVDFGALHEADAAGKDLATAIEAATTRVEPIAALTGKEKLADLKQIAADAGIVAEADWHSDDYRAAIDAKRNPPPPQPLSPPPVEGETTDAPPAGDA